MFAVARCSTMALIISSKKNQEQSVTSFLVWSLDKVSCRASCSWTSFPRLVLPSAASAPRSPPGIISQFFGTCIFRLHLIIAHIVLPTTAIMRYHVPLPIQQGFHHLFISEIYKLLPTYHFTSTEFKTPVEILSIALYVFVNLCQKATRTLVIDVMSQS